MPKSNDTPIHIRAFTFHGVDLEPTTNLPQYYGTCPFCDKERKFYVNSQDGLWDCKVCGRKGNPHTFLEQLWEESDSRTSREELAELARERRLLFPETLDRWGVVRSVTTRDWLIPGYNASGQVRQLYRYIKSPTSKTAILYPTPGLSHCIMGMGAYNKGKRWVYLCEGPWDGMALQEALTFSKYSSEEDKYQYTLNGDSCLFHECSVLAYPGCGAVGEPFKKWLPLFSDKGLFILGDSDHPQTLKGVPTIPAGYAAVKRAVELIAVHSAGEMPKSIYYLHWGPNGYAPELPSGYDVRDWLTNKIGGYSAATPQDRVQQLSSLFANLQPAPADWAPGTRTEASSSGAPSLGTLECTDWKTVRNAWRIAFKWTDGLDRALCAMLATALSTKAIGSQLWLQVIGPPSCGKSSLCEALSTNTTFIHAKSTLRGFHSGYDDGTGRNHSPLEKMIDKTLVVKDGDALLQIPNLGQVLSEARDVYDRVSRSSYRSPQSKDWTGINLTFILCGTASLRSLDSSELGERFLKVDIMEGVNDDLEDEILAKVIEQADADLCLEAGTTSDSQNNPDLTKAMQLTGGYVEYLRLNAQKLLMSVQTSEKVKEQIRLLGKFVSYMRARPSKTQEEITEREVASRLTIQLMRMAKCQAAVLNLQEITPEVMRRTLLIALSTARGRTLRIAKELYECRSREGEEEGLELSRLAAYTTESDDSIKPIMKFLLKIGAVEVVTVEVVRGLKSPPVWRLTPKLHKLYGEVIQLGESLE